MAGGAGCAIPSDYSPPAALSSNGLAAFSYTASLQQPSDVSANIKVTVRSSTDPYVIMMRLTKGSGSFGLSVAQKGTLGGALLGIGVAITICVGLTVYYLLKNCIKSNSSPGAVISAVPPQGQMPYGAQPAMIQAYGGKEQPPQYYAQPPQMVGMQEQMYVQPIGAPQAPVGYMSQPYAMSMPPQQQYMQPQTLQQNMQPQVMLPVGYTSQAYAIPQQYMQQNPQPQMMVQQPQQYPQQQQCPQVYVQR